MPALLYTTEFNCSHIRRGNSFNIMNKGEAEFVALITTAS